MIVQITEINGRKHMAPLEGVDIVDSGNEDFGVTITLTNGFVAKAYDRVENTNIKEMYIITDGKKYKWEFRVGEKGFVNVYGPDTRIIHYEYGFINWTIVYVMIELLWEQELLKKG